MSIFEEKENLTRAELRQILDKGPGKVSGYRQELTRAERMAIERELLDPKKYGPLISERDFNSAIKAVEKSKSEMSGKPAWYRKDRTARYMGGLLKPKKKSKKTTEEKSKKGLKNS